ncbi:MAG TPA: SpoIIE family protein phosphatase [Nocardioides sp.]|uniref:SpoIIE family protein phosphatase n=1 Tax=Nocardioides sp. TaxID=35761 RepID=UPI002F3FA8EF
MPGGDGPVEAAELGYLDALTEATVITDADLRVVFLNTAAERLLGLRRGLLLGRGLSEAVFSAVDQDPFREVSEQVLCGSQWTGELAVVRADGNTVRTEVSCAAVRRAGTVSGLACVLTELGGTLSRVRTAHRLADRLTGLARVAAELATAEDLERVTDIVIHEAADVVGATVGSLSLLADPDTLVLGGIRGGRAGVRERWTRYSVHDPTPAGDVVRSGERLVLIGRQAIRERYPDLERAAEGERSMIALPLRLTGRTIGVVTWSFPGRRRIDVEEMEFYGLLADTCAQAIVRIRAQEESTRQAARVRFLADATTTMSESLDYEQTLAEVARMAVPDFADWCAIDLLEDGRLQRLAVEHIDPDKVAVAVELERRYPAPRDGGGVWTVVRTGQPLLVPEITDEMVAPAAVDDEHRDLLLRLQLRSIILVPLIARGVVLGVMSWVMAGSDRRYHDDDVPFASDLGHRAAIAIDNSRLHTETLEAAVRLQRAVLPELSHEVPGWEIASFYSPAGRTDVGGDFFDVVPLPDGTLALFVGDVMGRGVRAAAAMAQMRAAVRAYISVDPDPGQVLRKLDGLFTTYDVSRLVTMVYVVSDTAGHGRITNAGHPPPMVLRARGGAEQLSAPGGPPLGMEADRRETFDFDLAVGDLLLAFTDGLIERRGEDIDVGQRRLLDALPALAGASLEDRLAAMVDGVRDHSRSDDVAALVVRRLG